MVLNYRLLKKSRKKKKTPQGDLPIQTNDKDYVNQAHKSFPDDKLQPTDKDDESDQYKGAYGANLPATFKYMDEEEKQQVLNNLNSKKGAGLTLFGGSCLSIGIFLIIVFIPIIYLTISLLPALSLLFFKQN